MIQHNYNGKDMNYWANEWKNIGGPNVIPMNGKAPSIGEYKNLLNKPVDQILHDYWIKNDFFKNGIGIVNGRCWHNKYKQGLWIHTIDVDSEIGKNLVLNLFGVQTLEELSKKGVVEQHKGDPVKFHLIIFTKGELPNLAANSSGVEIKGSGKLTTVTPTKHEDGTIREFVGDSLNSLASPIPIPHINFIQKMGEALKPFGINYLNEKGHTYKTSNNNAARILIETTDNVYKGARNPNLYAYACSVLMKYWSRKPVPEIKQMVIDTNQTRCVPPLEPAEVEQIWNSAFKSVDEEMAKENKKASHHQAPETEQKRITKQDIDFVIETITKEAKHDRLSIEQLFYGMASAFTKIPMPHNVNSKNSGVGKSYLMNLVADYYPSNHVKLLTGASSKALLHRDGIMVIRNEETGNWEPVDPIIEKLEVELEILENTENKDKSRIKEIEKEIKHLRKEQCKLIDLDNTIIVIQDTPEDSVIVNIMSLLRQDSTREQEYIFTDKSASGKIISGSNVIRGMPVLFTTRVIDDTKHSRFEEANRRSINVTPNVSEEKIKSANHLIASKYGLLSEEYDAMVVSRERKQKAMMIVSQIVEKLKKHSKYLRPKESGIKIPFANSIVHCIPSGNFWSMTVTDRLMRYLSIITKVSMDSRPRFVNIQTGAFYPIPTFEDLKETLELMERGASNVRPYIAEWYNKVFKSAYKELPEEPNSKVVEKGGKETTVKEERIGLTSNDLAEKTKEVFKTSKPSTDEILKKYLYPLLK
jgi:hypothetical protein